MTAVRELRAIVDRNRRQEPVGICSVCSAHPFVLQAAIEQALEDESVVLIESTCNQVNQFGGYTGMTPAQFRAFVHAIAQRARFPLERILLGGDHLGPYPWRSEPAASALQKAAGLVEASVAAGYAKIHLDASMACADDPAGRPLEDRIIAERAAALCEIAEKSRPEGSAPFYIIGTEVPTPGGEQQPGLAPAVTRVEDARTTLDHARAAFIKRGLAGAFERVIGLVVQPGVEFGDASVFEYDRTKARALSACIPAAPALVFEAHSTDYQPPAALRAMVEDHFAILKVGPWLTFAFREAVFALAAIERESLGARPGVTVSRVPEALDEAMLRHPANWQPYYRGGESEQHFARRYSYSDRNRYYWPDPSVEREFQTLLANLTCHEPPLTLLSQYMPEQYDAVRAGRLRNQPAGLIHDRIRKVLRIYAAACGR